MRIALHVTTLLVVTVLLGCAGPGTIPVDTGSAGVADYAAEDSASAVVVSGEDSQPDAANDTWREWLADPGVPGVDYDPRRIVVLYSADAEIPAALGAIAPPAGECSADQPNAILRQNAHFERLTDYIAATYGLSIRQQVYWLGANYASFGLAESTDADALLDGLNNNYSGLIERAYFDRLAKPAWIPNDPDYSHHDSIGGVLWGLKKVNCADAWDFTRGDPAVRVAVVDSGVRFTHEELTDTVLSPTDLADEIPDGYVLDIVNGDNTVEDLSGHGTMCAGAIAAANNGNTIIGVSPAIRVIPVKINNNGTFPWTDGYAGIVLAHMLGADVISCSWGHAGGFDNQERNIINQVTDGGSLVIGAAGNDDTTAAHWPSDFNKVVCVGASDPWDVRSSFSNYGSAVDIAAPGQWMKRARHETDTSYSDDGGGTSYACPMVAGAAALLLSADPALTPAEVKEILETTGDDVSGFDEGVKRLNVGAAMVEVNSVHVSIPYQPTQLVHSGIVTITPEIGGDAERVDALLNGNVVDSKTSAPWSFAIDTSSIDYGTVQIGFTGYQGADSSSDAINLLVDNSYGNFPIVETFEDLSPAFAGLDIKNYDPSLLDAIHTYGNMGDYWTPADLVAAGPGAWVTDSSTSFEGNNGMYCGLNGDTYGSFEMDTLVSQRIDLSWAENPTLVYHQRYNIQRATQIYDRGWVFITTDNGQTFTPAQLRQGGDALFSGYVANWETVEIDLSAYAGQFIHIVLAFESGRLNAGEESGEPAGWWVDDFTIATDYAQHPPAIGAVSVEPYSLFGMVAESPDLDVAVSDPFNVVRVRFVLDCEPLGSLEIYDSEVVRSAQPYEAVLGVPDSVPNQLANLQVFYYDDNQVAGPPRNIPVYIFNQLGDTNADGVVDERDIDGYASRVGLRRTDSGYVPFYDSDLDGVITEIDAAMVGYHFGEGS